jgi:hypothetical protein
MNQVSPIALPLPALVAPPARSADDYGYVRIASGHDENFSAFDPDAIGALREAYAWITQPARGEPGWLTYDARRFNQLTAMLRRAITREEIRNAETRVPS